MRFIILIIIIFTILYFIKQKFQNSHQHLNQNRRDDIYTDATINEDDKDNSSNSK